MTIARTERLLRTLAVALVALAAPAGTPAAVGIRNSAHDLSSLSTVPSGIRSTSETETCKFCHVPHRAQTTQLLWNRSYNGASSFTWGTDIFDLPVTTTSVYQTQLPTQLRNESRRCLSCHDGSVSIGLMALGGSATIAPTPGRTDQGRLTGIGKVIGAPSGTIGDLSGHHPVGIPYPGATSYGPQAIPSKVPTDKISTAKGGYWPSSGSGCQSPSRSCTIATGALNVNGANINLVRDTPTATVNVGVECTSCHDPHNRYGFSSFLRVNADFDGLCLSCHNK